MVCLSLDRCKWYIGRRPPGERSDRLISAFEHVNVEILEDKKARRRHFASSWLFNFMVVFATLANTVLIGLESDYSRGIQLADRLPWFICEVLFTTFFFVEMLLRINQLNWEYFVDPWNVFDYCLVVFSVADLVVSLAKTDGSGLRWAASLRVFRSLRIARAIRREKVVRGLFRITQGFIDALPSMLWTFLAAVLFAYMLAIVLTALVGSDLAARELWENAEVYCGTVTRSFFTILQIMTLDCAAEPILRPMYHAAPLGLLVTFLSNLILSFGVLNILFAIMVERMMIISHETQESRATAVAKSERLLMTAMLEEFTEYDQDYNGELDFWEFRKVLRTPGMTKKLSFLGVGPDEAESLFELMDVDKSGSLTPIEFLTGLFKVKGPAKGQDLCRLITLAEKNKRMATKWVTRVRHLNAKADEIQVRLNGAGRHLARELRGLQEASHRTDLTWSKAAQREMVIKDRDLHDQLDFPTMEDAPKRPSEGYHVEDL
ncbi:unnamed protein product [Durusdinium trenchii]|uniref:Sodium channel protein 60E (Drosophila ion channel 60) (Drosophila sodium channel 1) (Protein smell-impaired 60E) (Sodium channel 2) (DmNav2) n=2 Tax=Durusdinium trenchii TaxID=1381693 RepID=A0ABP0QG05_9DINO